MFLALIMLLLEPFTHTVVLQNDFLFGIADGLFNTLSSLPVAHPGWDNLLTTGWEFLFT